MPFSAAGPALTIAAIGDADVPDVIALWQRCGLTRPWNDPAADIALARGGTECRGAGRARGRQHRCLGSGRT